MLASLPIDVFVVGYSKEQESEADRDGTTLAVEAGYSYTGLIELVTSLENHYPQASQTSITRDGPISEAVQLTSKTLTGYFATHPPGTQRVDQLQREASIFRWKARPFKRLDVSFD